MDRDQSRPAPGDDNLALLKQDIDSGRTGDKVAAPDPGLSPLGTDDEAGGNAPSPAQIARARQQETSIAATIRPDEAGASGRKSGWPIVMMVGVIVVFALVIAAKVLIFR